MAAGDAAGAGRAVEWVRRRLQYQPVDAALFEQALTHRSAARANNERLEFLGDAVLNLIAAQYLYGQYPEADEGALSRLRAAIVNGDSLARVAAPLELGAALALGAGELKSGGFRRESILADALEAVCGALYLEAGFELTRRTFLGVLAPVLDAVDGEGGGQGLKDSKTRLQEWLQGRGLALPSYQVLAIEGEAHAQSFRVRCEIEALHASAQGEGPSRRRAEQAAAQQLLAQLGA